MKSGGNIPREGRFTGWEYKRATPSGDGKTLTIEIGAKRPKNLAGRHIPQKPPPESICAACSNRFDAHRAELMDLGPALYVCPDEMGDWREA